MEEHFCTYEQALALKELGFNEPCIGGWDKSKDWWWHPDSDINVDGPLKSQVFKWFRDEHHLFANIYEWTTGGFKDNIIPKDWKPECRWKIYKPVGITYSQKDKVLVHVSDNLYRDFYYYEEAESACIDKLIEIIKEKKS